MPAVVDLWIESLDNPSVDVSRFARLLSPEEASRAAKFRFDLHRNRYITGRGRLREILASYLCTSPGSISFSYNSYGKPALDSPHSWLAFNLAHTGSVAAYAVSADLPPGAEIGVDIEELRTDFSEDRIPERFFSPAEVLSLRALPQDQQNEAFFLCWTRKEAYVKALAQGLSIPLDSFDVSLIPGEEARFLRNADGWSIASFQVPGRVGAIVAPGDDWTWRFVPRP